MPVIVFPGLFSAWALLPASHAALSLDHSLIWRLLKERFARKDQTCLLTTRTYFPVLRQQSVSNVTTIGVSSMIFEFLKTLQ